jgi:hypothetical protein
MKKHLQVFTSDCLIPVAEGIEGFAHPKSLQVKNAQKSAFALKDLRVKIMRFH